MILKVAQRARFTVVDRQTIRDRKLSFRALGLLVVLLDAPPGASVNSEQLAGYRPEGRDAIRAALRELEDAGYLHRRKERGAGGRMVTVSIICERPVASLDQLDLTEPTDDGLPGVGSPGVGSPGVGGPGAKTERTSTAKAVLNYHDDALRIVGSVYRTRSPRPATPYRTAVTIVEKLLEAGHTPARVEQVLGKVATVSMSALEHALAKPRALKAVDQDRGDASGKVAL